MSRRSLTFSILAILLILAGCGKKSDQTPDSSAADSAEVIAPASRISVSDLAESALNGDAARALASLPPAEQIQQKPRTNRHDSTQVDTLRTLYYTGLFIQVYNVAASNQSFIQQMEVTSRDFATEEGITVGTNKADVEQKLGPPDEKDGETYIYNLDTEALNQLRIPFENNMVSRLSWTFYVD